MYNSGVAEDHQRQWQPVTDEYRKESNGLCRGIILVDRKQHARSLHNIGTHSWKRYHKRRDDDPDKSDCSIDVMLLDGELQNDRYYIISMFVLVFHRFRFDINLFELFIVRIILMCDIIILLFPVILSVN